MLNVILDFRIFAFIFDETCILKYYVGSENSLLICVIKLNFPTFPLICIIGVVETLIPLLLLNLAAF